MKPKKLILAILLVFVAGLFRDSAIAAERPTTLTINNVAPSFTSGPSDGPSSGTLPTNAGNLVTITARAHDNNADDYYLAVCKTQYVKAGNNATPSCCTDAGLGTCTNSEKWAISATAVASDSEATVTYTTSSGNIESNDWYAFVCDNNASGLCSASSQGTGDDGSPFKVNHAPSFDNVTIGPTCGSSDPVPPGNYSSGGGGPLWSLDSNFNSGGIVTTTVSITLGDTAKSVAIQSDGKIVAVGHSHNFYNNADSFALARYTTTGALDPTFGTEGIVTTSIGNGNSFAYSVAIQSDGKIVVAGMAYDVNWVPEFAIVRYDTYGALDTTFDSDGMVTTAVSSYGSSANSVKIQADGKIVVVGDSVNGSTYNNELTVVRYDTYGALDTTFDSDGIVTTAVGNGNSSAKSVAIQSTGEIVAAGTSWNSSTYNTEFAVVRYDTYGALDTTFDSDGMVTTAVGSGSSYANSVAIQSDGKIVAMGQAYDEESNQAFAVVRYDTYGALDTTFDSDGMVTTAIGDAAIEYSGTIDSNGKIVVGGYSLNGSVPNFAIVRYKTDGSLDTDFDTDGIVTTVIGSSYSYVYGVAIDSNGKIVAAGYGTNGSNSNIDFYLVRYDTDGSLDTGFDTDGIVNTDFGSKIYDTSIRSTAIQQSDGKIVVAGTGVSGSENDFVLARYNADGSLDGNFGGGFVITPIDSWAEAYAVAVQDDGKIVAAGKSNNGGDYDIAVVRYNFDGTLDDTFGGDGIVTTQIGGGGDQEQANAVAIDYNGKIIIAGKQNDGSKDNFVLVRYNDDGSLDTSFDTDGIVSTAIGSDDDQAYSVTIDSDGKIIVAGTSDTTPASDFAVARYNDDGSLDTTFSGDGLVTTDVGEGSADFFSVAIQDDDKIVAAGRSFISGHGNFTIVRYNTNGSLDTTFDTDGIVTTQMGEDGANAVVILGDGKIVATGYYDNGSNTDFAVVSYNTDGSPDTDFGTNGVMTEAVGSAGDTAYAVAIQDDGAIVVAGESDNGSNIDFALVRYVRSSTSGFVDDTFGTSGTVTTPIAFNADDQVYSQAIQSDGKIVAVGISYDVNLPSFSVVRYNTDGTLDTDFGTGGR